MEIGSNEKTNRNSKVKIKMIKEIYLKARKKVKEIYYDTFKKIECVFFMIIFKFYKNKGD